MIQHIIAIASSYKLGKRIAWHYADKQIDYSILEEVSEKTKQVLGKPDYVIHKLSTDSKDWSSVVIKDSFFEDYLVFDDLDEFLAVILADKTVTALDIAKLLLSISPMSNLKLQKMIYLVYADYLIRTKKQLFQDKIIAFQYGPVVEDVYQYYKGYGRSQIDATQDKKIVLDEITVPITLAKILQSDDNLEILTTVKEIFEKFGAKTASELVEITHRKGSPWDKVSNIRNGEITDELIEKYHEVEII